MELGLTPWNFSDKSAASLAEQAKFAEGLGYSSFWLPENHFNDGAIPDPLMLLAAVAAVTSRIRLGTTSYLLTLRNPLQAAEQVAVLDQLSAGRVILGVGRGYAPDMLQAFNVVPKDKRKIFQASLESMIAAWSGEPVVIGDEKTVVLDPVPVQRPHPPIWVAAFGPKALAQAGRLGWPYLASPMESLATLEENYRIYSEAAQAAQRPLPDCRPIMRSIFVTANARQANRIKQKMADSALSAGRRGDVGDVDDWAVIGDSHFVGEKLAEYEQRLGLTHLVATRLRIGGIAADELKQSIAKVAELVGG